MKFHEISPKPVEAPLHSSTLLGRGTPTAKERSSGLVTLREVFPPCGWVSETPSVSGHDLEVNQPDTTHTQTTGHAVPRGFSFWAGPALHVMLHGRTQS